MIPDSRDKVVRVEKSEYVIFREEQVGAIGGQARYFGLTTIDVRENFINNAFAVGKAIGDGGAKTLAIRESHGGSRRRRAVAETAVKLSANCNPSCY